MSPTPRALPGMALLVLVQCASPPAPPRPVAVVPVPAVTPTAPTPSVAPPPVVSVEAPKTPEPPPPHLAPAGAAIVWLDDPKALGGFRSALIEPAPGGAKVVAERPGAVLASTHDLWALRVKKTVAVGCAECEKCSTDPPTCKRNQTTPLDEPFLQSLRTGRVLEPWRATFVPSKGCADGLASQEAGVSLRGAAGPVLFAVVSKAGMGCVAAHPFSEGSALAFDLDTEAVVTPTVPAPAAAELVERAHRELLAMDCAQDPDEKPALWEATAQYGEEGRLRGVYAFTMSAPYACGLGPGHYSILSRQTSPWIPPEVAAYGQLPAFVAGFLAEKHAVHAMPIAPGRVAEAEREMARK